MKFLSKENFEYVWAYLSGLLKEKMDKPINGVEGQVLTKTKGGSEWKDPAEGVTQEEVEKAIDEALYESVEYVDLGLPSGLLWATCNLGAEKETDYGLYYQWGDIRGYKKVCAQSESDGNDDAHYFEWSKYKYCNGSTTTLTKYCTHPALGTVDNKSILEPEDDAAAVILRSQWRMPTVEEFQELIENTDPGEGANQYGWIENYNGSSVNGLLRKSKTNGNTIFFPASGICHGTALSVGNTAQYWSSSRYGALDYEAHTLAGGSSSLSVGGEVNRCYGLPVRGVTSSTNKQPKFQPSFIGGTVGQVLTKTSIGPEWKDAASGVCIVDSREFNGIKPVPKDTIDKLVNAIDKAIPIHLYDDEEVTTPYSVWKNDECVYVCLVYSPQGLMTLEIDIATGEVTSSVQRTFDAGAFGVLTGAFYSTGGPRQVIKLSQSYTFPYIGDNASWGISEYHVIISNVGLSEIVVSIPSSYKSNTDSITIQPDDFAEINIVKDTAGNWYLRAIENY